jgi:hypothetical protein
MRSSTAEGSRLENVMNRFNVAEYIWRCFDRSFRQRTLLGSGFFRRVVTCRKVASDKPHLRFSDPFMTGLSSDVFNSEAHNQRNTTKWWTFWTSIVFCAGYVFPIHLRLQKWNHIHHWTNHSWGKLYFLGFVYVGYWDAMDQALWNDDGKYWY